MEELVWDPGASMDNLDDLEQVAYGVAKNHASMEPRELMGAMK